MPKWYFHVKINIYVKYCEKSNYICLFNVKRIFGSRCEFDGSCERSRLNK